METVIEIAAAVAEGKASAREMVDRALDRIDRGDKKLNAFVHLAPEQARADAEKVDRAIARGESPGPLSGVPFGVKDMDHCKGMPVSYGSLVHKGRPVSEADSINVARLREAGAIPIGMTACSEFGTVQFTRTRAWGITRNPWNLDLTSGGSSSDHGISAIVGCCRHNPPYKTRPETGRALIEASSIRAGQDSPG